MAGTSAQLLGGLGALAAAAVAGLAFVHRPWPNRLDVWGYAVLPADPASHWAHDLVAAGSLVALIGGVAAVFAVAILRDWVRAVACATAPVLAVLIVQDLAKPLVGRHLGITGSASYPSGTVAAVAALMTAAVLVTPKVARPLVAMAGAAVTAGVCAAVQRSAVSRSRKWAKRFGPRPDGWDVLGRDVDRLVPLEDTPGHGLTLCTSSGPS
jgi:hypothetical protein